MRRTTVNERARGPRRLKLSRPSPALIVACLALFVALGSTAYAVKIAPRNSVVSKSIKNGQVKGTDVRNDSLSGKDIREASLAGLGAGILGAQWNSLTTAPNPGVSRPPTGRSSGPGADVYGLLVPVDAIVRDFRAEVSAPPGAGNKRSLGIAFQLPEGGGFGTFGCDVAGASRTCSSGGRSRALPAGTLVFGLEGVPDGSGAPAAATANVGYQLLTSP